MMSHLRAFRDTEPARVRALWAAVVGLLTAAGISVSADLDAAVTATIAAVFAILPLLQGEATRRRVTPAPDDGPTPPAPDPTADVEIADAQLAGDLADALSDPGGEVGYLGERKGDAV